MTTWSIFTPTATFRQLPAINRLRPSSIDSQRAKYPVFRRYRRLRSSGSPVSGR